MNEDFKETLGNYSNDINDVQEKNYSAEIQCYRRQVMLDDINNKTNEDKE